MSKVKHLLRKLHIGDHHGRPPALDPLPQATPSASEPQPSAQSLSLASDAVTTTASSETEVSNSSNDTSNFNFLEEEFQVQLALAISVSDPGRSDDRETAQINAAKQISLGRSPSQSLAEFLSLRYWSYNVLNYDEKVMDGFYDVCGVDSNLMDHAKMPSLIDLEAISFLDRADCEVVLVNRAIDMELQQLEQRVYLMSMECHALVGSSSASILVQNIAQLVVDRMGGPVSDVEEIFRRWRARSYDLKIFSNTIILPLGSLDVGHSRHRALLFKVLADRINLPCKLVKGSYYTGTDEGAVNLIKLDNGSEYIIDLMGAPGSLIPTEAPSGLHQNFGLDMKSITPLAVTKHSSPDIASISLEVKEADGELLEKIKTERLEREFGDFHLPLREDSGDSFGAIKKETDGQNLGMEAVSQHGISDRGEKVIGRNQFVRHERMVGDKSQVDNYSSEKQQALAAFTGEQICVNSCRNHPAAGLPADLGSACIDPARNSSFGIAGKGHVVINPKADGLIQNEDFNISSAEVKKDVFTLEAMETTCSDQSNAGKTYNMEIDPVLNGVAEILWEDLQIGERIGIGSYGEVYRGEWNGTEVAVKRFMNQDISGDALARFISEVEIMLRLRHPNVVLFMGAVTHPPNLSILTEFLPRGSLYKLLHRPNIHIDEKRRIRMALDVAKGMNYLHTSHPIIVHRDLKTPNLLVDKNWVVKVCDFGMSRLQHHTFLSSKSAAGTAEWMAPEVLRNEPSNEKSDIYSFGVILWELATLRVPWSEMNSMQVVGAVGFQGRHLDIPPTVDPLVAEIIRECWNLNPQARPSFSQIIMRLKCLQRLNVQKTGTCANEQED